MKNLRRLMLTLLIGAVLTLISACGSGTVTGRNASDLTAPNPLGSAVSGTVTLNGVGLGNVTITLSGLSHAYTGTTDSSGSYTIGGVPDGTYTATPSLVGYTFTPQNLPITVNGANVAGNDFAATAIPTTVMQTYTVSGTIKTYYSGSSGGVGIASSGTGGLSGVTVTLSGGSGSYSATTDSSGSYTISGVNNGTYMANAVLVGYTFTPQNQIVTVSGADATMSEFTATAVGAAKVYVIAKSAGSVVEINANTLAIEKTINLGVSLLNSIAIVGDTLWYSWGDQWGFIGRYNLTTGVNETKVLSSIYEGLLRASPAQPGVLYVGEQGQSPADIQKFDISVDPPVLLAKNSDVGGSLGDFKISADGSKIWSACGAPYYIAETRTSDMQLSGTTFDTGAYPTAVDRTTVNGSEVLVGGTNSIYDTDIHVFLASNPSNPVSYETGLWSQSGNVAISPDAAMIYSVHTDDYLGATGTFVTVSRLTGFISKVSISANTTFNSGIGVDSLSGRVFVATLDSVSVFDALGHYVGTIPSVAGASTILVVAP